MGRDVKGFVSSCFDQFDENTTTSNNSDLYKRLEVIVISFKWYMMFFFG